MGYALDSVKSAGYMILGAVILYMILRLSVGEQGNMGNKVNEVYNKAQSGYTVIVDGIEVKSGLSKDIINSGVYGKTYFVDDEGKQIIVSLSK